MMKQQANRGRYMDFMSRGGGVVQNVQPKPVAKTAKPAPKPVARPVPKTRPVVKQTPRPVALKPTPTPRVVPEERVFKTTTVIKEVDYGVIEDFEPTKSAPAEEPVKEPETPDNNKYVLGGKSPFISSVNVEKRPLSSHIPERGHPKEKNVYTATKHEIKEENIPTKVVSPKPKSGFGLVLIILLTILLGAAVGAGVYLCFFNK